MKHQSFELEKSTFNKIRDLFQTKTGVHLSEDKVSLVRNRLSKILLRHNFNSFEDLLEALKSKEHPKIIQDFISELTTTTTSFYRIPYHFDYIKIKIGESIKQIIKEEGLFKCLSAGCSSGQEPYSIAITLHQILGQKFFNKVIIDAIDINQKVLEKAKAANYHSRYLEQLSRTERSYFDFDGKHASIKDTIKKRIFFSNGNILNSRLNYKEYDIIFCRNTLIYFSKENQKKLTDKIYDQLKNEGYLFCGPSENVQLISKKFTIIDPKGIYKKVV